MWTISPRTISTLVVRQVSARVVAKQRIGVLEVITIDLFAGAGGLTQGFREMGYRSVFANEFDSSAAATFRRNHPETECSEESIVDLDAEAVRTKLGLTRGELDVLLGGPPCQGFSTYGKRDPADDRNQLYLHYLRFLEEFQPRFYVIENVVGLISMGNGAVLADILSRLTNAGYTSNVFLLNSADYGVPQSRKRVFIIGSRNGVKVDKPIPTHALIDSPSAQSDFFRNSVTLQPYVTVDDAISDLPEIALKPKDTHEALEYEKAPTTDYQRWASAGSLKITHHSAKQMLGIRHLRLALMHPGDYGSNIEARLQSGGLPPALIDKLMYGDGNLRDVSECRTQDREKELQLRELLAAGNITVDGLKEFLDAGGFANKYRRLKADEPSHTLVAHMARDCSDFVHPRIDRFISVREAARLQSFPDIYYFEGSQFAQFKQIGNAVPPIFGRALALAILDADRKDGRATQPHSLQTAM